MKGMTAQPTRRDKKAHARAVRNPLRVLKNSINCPHMVLKHILVPHPRYGDRVPHFRSWCESDITACGCKVAKQARAEFIERLETEFRKRPAAPPAPELPAGAQACRATTLRGARCRNVGVTEAGMCARHRNRAE